MSEVCSDVPELNFVRYATNPGYTKYDESLTFNILEFYIH
jgi:hypothetical protein